MVGVEEALPKERNDQDLIYVAVEHPAAVGQMIGEELREVMPDDRAVLPEGDQGGPRRVRGKFRLGTRGAALRRRVLVDRTERERSETRMDRRPHEARDEDPTPSATCRMTMPDAT